MGWQGLEVRVPGLPCKEGTPEDEGSKGPTSRCQAWL